MKLIILLFKFDYFIIQICAEYKNEIDYFIIQIKMLKPKQIAPNHILRSPKSLRWDLKISLGVSLVIGLANIPFIQMRFKMTSLFLIILHM